MAIVERLEPAGYARIPWKNGRGELVVIDQEGRGGWHDRGIDWHFGSTTIAQEGPFSDYSGYQRLQVVIEGRGLVLVAADREIDLREPLVPKSYDGGLPVHTRLEHGPVRVVNLIFNRARFAAGMRVLLAHQHIDCASGRHLIYAMQASCVEIAGERIALAPDAALRVRAHAPIAVAVPEGAVIVGSVASIAGGA